MTTLSHSERLSQIERDIAQKTEFLAQAAGKGLNASTLAVRKELIRLVRDRQRLKEAI